METIFMSPTAFRASSGKLNSSKRYIQRTENTEDFVMTGGKTMIYFHYTYIGNYGYSFDGYGMKYSVNNIVYYITTNGGTEAGFSATVVKVVS